MFLPISPPIANFNWIVCRQVWRTEGNEDFVRVIHEGIPVQGMNSIPFSEFVQKLEAQVPENIYQVCTS